MSGYMKLSMLKKLTLFLVATWCCCTSIADAVCISDTADINAAELALADSSIPRTYNLCSDSFFEFQDGVLGYYGTYYVADGPGMPPIRLINPNVNILCGPDGNIAHNCTFSGGTFQVILTDGSYYYSNTETVTDILLQGIKFTGMSGNDAIQNIFVNPTDYSSKGSALAVKDCLFYVSCSRH